MIYHFPPTTRGVIGQRTYSHESQALYNANKIIMATFDYSFDELSVALSYALMMGSGTTLNVAPTAAPAAKAGKTSPKKATKKTEKKKPVEDDDDVDLFGDDDVSLYSCVGGWFICTCIYIYT